MVGERLTWRQIQEKYPDQWIGITDVEYESDNDSTIRCATVIAFIKERMSLQKCSLIPKERYWQDTLLRITCFSWEQWGNWMKQFTLKLDKNYQRPVIELKDWHNFEALLDTGAFFPIWTANENILQKAGGERKQEGVSLFFPICQSLHART